jgi:catechol 2,3-dioxygenase-like lactoylglutathione lyase family enzyme
MTDTAVPRLFRINLQVGDIARAASFYADLLGVEGRTSPDGRAYFDTGGVTLQVMQVPKPHPAPRALHFAVVDLDAVHIRAAALESLADYEIRGVSAGAPATRPWGERSFYCDDPWGNPLCFVEEGTLFAG